MGAIRREIPDVDTMSAKALNKILHDTVDNIENNKSQIYDIYESVRNEVETSRRELKEIKKIAA